MNIFLLFISLVFNGLVVFSQSAKLIDSLKYEIEKTNEKEKQIDLCIELSKVMYRNGDSTAIVYIKQAEELAKSDNTLFVKVKGHEVNYLIDNNLFDSASNVLNRVFYRAKTIKDSIMIMSYQAKIMSYTNSLTDANKILERIDSLYDKKFLVDSKSLENRLSGLLELSYNYGEQGNSERSLFYSLKALEIYEKNKVDFSLASIYMCVGASFHYANQFDKQILYLNKAKKIFETENILMGITSCDLNLATAFIKTYNYDSAVFYSKKVIPVGISLNRKRLLITAYGNLAESYIGKQEYDSAINYSLKGNELNREINYPKGRVECMIRLAESYYQIKKYREAILYGQKVIELSDSIAENNAKIGALMVLYESYKKQNNYEKALEYYLKYTSLNDSLFNEEKHKQIVEIETKYETEKKDLEIESLASANAIQQLEINQKNTFLYGTIGLFVLLGLVGFLLFRQNKMQQEQKTSMLEQKLLRTQMNPHFMSNALASIQMYMYKNDPKEAAKYLGKYGKLTRQILEASRKDYITLDDELNMLENYLAIQQLIAPKPFEFSIKVDDNIDVQEALIPPMIAQPFIENAIKHGLELKQEDNRALLVEFKTEKNELLLSITDNGVGRLKSKENKEEHHISYATTITNERIGFLKQKHKRKISFNIIDLVEANIPIGTKVEFKMPLIYSV